MPNGYDADRLFQAMSAGAPPHPPTGLCGGTHTQNIGAYFSVIEKSSAHLEELTAPPGPHSRSFVPVYFGFSPSGTDDTRNRGSFSRRLTWQFEAAGPLWRFGIVLVFPYATSKVGMRPFLPDISQTGPEAASGVLCCETQPVENFIPTGTMAASGQTIASVAPQAAIGVEKTFVEGGTSSSSSSPLATTPSSGLVKSLVTALFGECEGISAVAVESGAAEGEEEKKARQTENNTAVRENDVSAGGPPTGQTTPTAASGTTISRSMSSLLALEVAKSVDERENAPLTSGKNNVMEEGVQKAASGGEKERQELLVNFVGKMCASIIDTTEKTLLEVVDVLMEFLASVRKDAFSAAK